MALTATDATVRRGRPAVPEGVKAAWVTVALLAVTTVALRVPFLTPRLAHWDAINYALALHDFNVAAHQPHPPGSLYFVLLARGAFVFTGDDNAALTAVSVLASVAAVLAEYALARLLFGKKAGVLAAVVLMTQPVFWGYGSMATPWTLLAFLALCIGLTSALLLQKKRWLVLPSAVLMGVASGFRLDATVFMAPLWMWAVSTAEPRWRHRLRAIGVVLMCSLIWLVPVAINTGGATLWFDRTRTLFAPTEDLHQLANNTAISFGTLALVVGPAVVMSLFGDRRAVRQNRWVFWLLWVAPAFVFLWLIDSTEPGHDLVFSVALCALGAGVLVRSIHDQKRLLACAALVVAAQTTIWLFASPLTEKPPAWVLNSMVLNVTAPGLRQQQASLADTLHIIRSQFDPHQTVVLTVTGQDPYRFMMYYLPEYRVLQLDPQAHSILAATGRQQGTWQPATECQLQATDVVWVLLSRSEPGLIPGAALLSPSDATPFQVWHTHPTPDTPDYAGFALSPARPTASSC
jgi:4-amino-4-deoxy-L-arabinose transferase-like glycosyltransferase